MNIKERFNELNCCVIIPTYNNEKTVVQVIQDVEKYTSNIIVVIDGSTDSTLAQLEPYIQLELIAYSKNRGKGYAIRQGFLRALALGYSYAITLDSDGQHYAADLPSFLDELEKSPYSLLIGSRFMEGKEQSKSSGFANKFSNFWFHVETGVKLPDTQSGFRLYPIKALEKKQWFCNKYEFEIEVIVRAVWAGVPIKSVPIDVYYPPQEERVTHFRPFKDFFRISVLNSVLVTLALLYYRPKLIYLENSGKSLKEIYNKHILSKHETNGKIAAAIGFGVFMGIVPIWGYQLLVGFVLAHWFKLNKAVFFLAANISLPPMIPFILYLSYVAGSFLLGHGSWEVDMTLDIASIGNNILQYLVGAVVLAIAMGVIFYAMSYFLLSIFSKKQPK